MPARFHRPDVADLIGAWHAECGRRVSRRRELFSLHRRELADLCVTSEATIVRIEQGLLRPKDELRVVISAVLCCEVADLWPYPSCEQVCDLALEVA